jgi:hypothetical protein
MCERPLAMSERSCGPSTSMPWSLYKLATHHICCACQLDAPPCFASEVGMTFSSQPFSTGFVCHPAFVRCLELDQPPGFARRPLQMHERRGLRHQSSIQSSQRRPRQGCRSNIDPTRPKMQQGIARPRTQKNRVDYFLMLTYFDHKQFINYINKDINRLLLL